MNRKMILAAFCAAAGLVSLTTAGSALAADPAPAGGESHFLADRHVQQYGLKCESCHTKDMKVKQSGDYDVCVDCHGDYEKMIKKTEGKYQVSGEMDVTAVAHELLAGQSGTVTVSWGEMPWGGSLSAGTYRVVKSVTLGGEDLTLGADFTVS